MAGQSRWFTVVGGAGALLLAALPHRPALAVDAKRPPCVSYQTEARFRMGYDHLVHITNQCTRPVQCTVRTDVNPTDVSVRVAARSAETVLTYRGSPASTFRAEVSCKWDR